MKRGLAATAVYLGVCVIAWPLDFWTYAAVVVATFCLLSVWVRAGETR